MYSAVLSSTSIIDDISVVWIVTYQWDWGNMIGGSLVVDSQWISVIASYVDRSTSYANLESVNDTVEYC